MDGDSSLVPCVLWNSAHVAQHFGACGPVVLLRMLVHLDGWSIFPIL